MRTWISNYGWVVVHSLRRQRTNQESDLGAQPLRTRIVVACYTQKTLSHFLLNTRGSCIAKTLLSPPQRGRRKRRDFYGKNIKPVGTGLPDCPFQCETNYALNLWGRAPTWVLTPFGKNRTAKNSAKKFPQKFLGFQGVFFQKDPLVAEGLGQRPLS